MMEQLGPKWATGPARYLAVHTSCCAGAAGHVLDVAGGGKKPPSQFITVRWLFRCRPFARYQKSPSPKSRR
jgi:hypothetical protein